MAFFLAFSHPEVFSYAGVLSPAFMLYSQTDLEDWVRSSVQEEKSFLYLYSGAGDPLEKSICRRFRKMCSFLKKVWLQDMMKHVVRPEQIHHEDAWEPVFQDFLHMFLNW